MRRIALLLALVACGGKLFGEGNNNGGSDGGAGADGSDPLGGGGHLNKGPCIFTPAFMPHGQNAIANPPVMGVGVSAGTPKSFSITCSGTAADTFYYATEMDGITAMAGTQQMVMGTLKQTTNGREGESAAGKCAVTITSVTSDNKVTGTFDCTLIDDPIGTFLIKGEFDGIPL